MPTADDYLRLRRMTGEAEEAHSRYSNTDLELYLADAGDDFNLAAATIWAEKASAYADLVNINEAGSSRSNSDLFKHAKEQQTHYESMAGTGSAQTVQGTTTRRIVRA
jgi:hypothetical protein